MKQPPRSVAFAMEFADDAPPLIKNVVAVSWAPEALKVLRQILDDAKAHVRAKDDDASVNLPYGFLRAQLHLKIDDWIRIADDVGMRSPYMPKVGAPDQPWAFILTTDARSDLQKIKEAFDIWSQGPLAHFCESRGAFAHGVARLRQLSQEDKVVKVSASRVQIFPWAGMPPAKVGAPTPFDITAGVLAARLAGHELFPGLGPVVRVVGESERNSAEVMTRPRMEAGGRFSLVCQLSMQSIPGDSRRLIFCEFKRRRWADSIKNGYTISSSIRGFVLPHAMRPNSAYQFAVSLKGGKWTTDLGYEQYEHAFELADGYQGEAVIKYPCDESSSSVVVMFKAEVTEQSGSKLQAGVPLVDQADAFDRIADLLADVGLRRFTDFEAVKTKPVKAPPLKMLKAEVTLARLLDQYDDADASAEEALKAVTGETVERWFSKGLPSPEQKRDMVVASIRTLTAGTAYLADAQRQNLYVVGNESADVEWIKTTADALLGDHIKVVSVRLPANTHGPKESFPEETKRQRFEARTREWIKFADQIKLPPRSMVLVEAPLYYEFEGKKKRDDKVNKLAARIALASLGCTVQYLLPSEPGRIDKFLPRVQAALLDLIFGHAGSVWGLKQACAACFSEASAPKWVGAISSLVVFSELPPYRPQSVLVATKLDRETGRAWVRFAHQAAEFTQSDWMRFDEGPQYLATTRVEFPHTSEQQRELTSKFLVSTFDHVAKLDPGAVIFIDSTRAARLASWLTDVSTRDNKREVAPQTFAGERWPGLRLVRIREQAPVIGQENTVLAEEEGAPPIKVWTSTQRLFHVNGATVPTYWSLAKPSTHHKRGASCYRSMLLPASSKGDVDSGKFSQFPAQPDKQHLNARAVEIVVLQKQGGDDDAQLASFAQHLRAGMLTARNETWVTTPTPLRIIDKLSEYLKA